MGHKPICGSIACFVTSPRPRATKSTNLCANTTQHLARVLYSLCDVRWSILRHDTFPHIRLAPSVLRLVDFCSFIVFYPHLSMSIILKRDLFFLSAVVIFLITSMNFLSGSLEHIENINSNEHLCPTNPSHISLTLNLPNNTTSSNYAVFGQRVPACLHRAYS